MTNVSHSLREYVHESLRFLPLSLEEVAMNILEGYGVAIDDLYSFALPRLKEIQVPANVHFTKTGSQEVAQVIEAALKK